MICLDGQGQHIDEHRRGKHGIQGHVQEQANDSLYIVIEHKTIRRKFGGFGNM